ncbi:unnamed protein product, partial [Rotaria sp. Silwood2]
IGNIVVDGFVVGDIVAMGIVVVFGNFGVVVDLDNVVFGTLGALAGNRKK